MFSIYLWPTEFREVGRLVLLFHPVHFLCVAFYSVSVSSSWSYILLPHFSDWTIPMCANHTISRACVPDSCRWSASACVSEEG